MSVSPSRSVAGVTGKTSPSAAMSPSRSHSSGNTSAGHHVSTMSSTTEPTNSRACSLSILALEDPAALGVDHFALPVHDLVVLQDVLAALEVELLDLLLRVLDRPRYHLRLDGLVVGPVELVHDRGDPVAREHPHQVVLEREVEQRLTRIALAAGATAELVVDAPGLVTFGSEHVQPAHLHDVVVLGIGLCLELREDRLVLGLVGRPLVRVHLEEQVPVVVEVTRGHLLAGEVLGVPTEQDVDAAARHVGGNRDGALAAGLRHHHGFLLVVLRVQDVVGDAAAPQHARQALGLLDRHRPDEDRLPVLVAFEDVVGDRVPLGVLGLVDRSC